MNDDSRFYVIDKKILPEVFIKVVEAKKLMENGKVKTIQDAVSSVGISRSAFYKYKEFVFPLNEYSRGRTVTFGLNLDNTLGLLSNVLNVIAGEGANILTINQTIPINNIANVTITVETNVMTAEFDLLLEKLEKISGVLSIKIIAREWF